MSVSRRLARARLARIVWCQNREDLVSRILAMTIGVGLGGLAGVVLAMASLIDAEHVLGPGLAWFEPYFRLAGIAAGGLILAAAFLVIGVPTHHRRSEEVRW
jgi:hypothetical protein